MRIKLTVNGRQFDRHVPADMMLLDFLREQGFVSVKRGCETSNCGLCTVWVDEHPVLSCTYPAARAEGKRVTTIEGVRTVPRGARRRTVRVLQPGAGHDRPRHAPGAAQPG